MPENLSELTEEQRRVLFEIVKAMNSRPIRSFKRSDTMDRFNPFKCMMDWILCGPTVVLLAIARSLGMR